VSFGRLKKYALQLAKNIKTNELILNGPHRLMLYQYTEKSGKTASLYDPVFCLIIQGEKQLQVGERELVFRESESLIVSHQMPVVSSITKASPSIPYVALVLCLDLNIIRGLYEDFGEATLTMQSSSSMETAKIDSELCDALYRLVKSSQSQSDVRVLFGQILREVHYRLLQSSSGGMLRELILVDSHASKIAKAVTFIRENFTKQVSIPEISKLVSMSTSSFHTHFKAITNSTPLQYQKDLRLLEAKRLIVVAGETISNAAFKVGYESLSQFSREYSRKFGNSPAKDMNR
jgi:AraC-like DNA-binding protein